MLGSFNIECSGCGKKIDLHNGVEGKDYTIENHENNECFFCDDCKDSIKDGFYLNLGRIHCE